MSGRKTTLLYATIPTQSGATAIDTRSTPTSVQYLDNISFVANTTGTLVGTLKVWGANQYVDPTKGQVVTNWTEAFNSQPTIDLTNPNITINMNQFSPQWIALQWVPTSGTGNITVEMLAKQVGA